MVSPAERAERMYPDSSTTYGVGAVREAYVYGAVSAEAIASVTPCSCSAQRARADRAIAERDEARAEVERLRDRLGDLADEPYLSDRLRDARVARDQAVHHAEVVERQRDDARAAIARVRALVNDGQTVGWIERDGDIAWIAAEAIRRALDGES